ncbi:MAG: PQQ-like beta-propeller repeat protein [Bacteroidales bacterium]|nr:PQQ-like beta-propeller repeat protein [Bacteroidales bacterium]
MKNLAILIPVIALLAGQGCMQERIEKSAQWRGANRDGIFHETDLLDQWPEEVPELLWVFEGLGRGFAAPAVTAEGLFVNGEQEGNSFLFALDLEGRLLWKSPNGKEFLGEGFSSTYPGDRSTPTVYGKRVYSSSGQGQISCFELTAGKELWSVNITGYLDGILGYFGYSESVAVDEDHVYCFPGGPGTNLAALDRFTGKIVWTQSAHRDTFAYGSPVLIDLNERPILMTTSRHHLFIVDRSNGSVLASYKLEGYEYDGEHCNTPVYSDGHIYYVANDVPGQGAVKLELSGNGELISEVWRNNQVLNNFGGLVVVDGKLFTTVKGNRLVALDPESGAVADTLKVATGSIIYTDHKFIIYGNNGTINLVNYEQKKLEQAGQMNVKEGSGQHFAHPVVANGVLYIRHGDALMAYRIK